VAASVVASNPATRAVWITLTSVGPAPPALFAPPIISMQLGSKPLFSTRTSGLISRNS